MACGTSHVLAVWVVSLLQEKVRVNVGQEKRDQRENRCQYEEDDGDAANLPPTSISMGHTLCGRGEGGHRKELIACEQVGGL